MHQRPRRRVYFGPFRNNTENHGVDQIVTRPYKIMLFAYAWVLIEPHHHQAFAYLQMNLLYMYDAKNSLYNIV